MTPVRLVCLLCAIAGCSARMPLVSNSDAWPIGVLSGQRVATKRVQARRQLAAAAYNSSEARAEDMVERYMESIRGNRALLTAFINQMPKGADLHLHYSGAIYAESFIRDALAKNFSYCRATGTLAATTDSNCAWVTLGQTVKDGTFTTVVGPTLLQKFSIYNYIHGAANPLATPADHFFATFFEFGAVSKLDVPAGMKELKKRAMDENISYLELMLKSGSAIPFKDQATYKQRMWDIQTAQDEATLTKLLEEIYTTAIDKATRDKATKDYIAYIEMANAGIEEKGFRIRYQAYGTRTLDPDAVFGQLVNGFDAANASPLVVGVNIVAAENDAVSLRDFWLHMRFFKFLSTKFPAVKKAIHAGELVLGMVPPEYLRFHITDSLLVAGANRIGHGVDIGFEDNSAAVLDYMVENEAVLEINLSSNSFILGADADLHPNSVYLDSGVPCVISSDDPGILRGSLTEEYIRLVNSYQYISYTKVKELVRNSLKYSFVKEANLKQAMIDDLETRFKLFEYNLMVGANVPLQ